MGISLVLLITAWLGSGGVGGDVKGALCKRDCHHCTVPLALITLKGGGGRRRRCSSRSTTSSTQRKGVICGFQLLTWQKRKATGRPRQRRGQERERRLQGQCAPILEGPFTRPSPALLKVSSTLPLSLMLLTVKHQGRLPAKLHSSNSSSWNSLPALCFRVHMKA